MAALRDGIRAGGSIGILSNGPYGYVGVPRTMCGALPQGSRADPIRPNSRLREMSDSSSDGRTYDRDEVALILHEAAQLDTPRVDASSRALPAATGDDRLTLTAIEHAAAAVGIAPAAVTAAWLRRTLGSARDESGRIHVSHDLAGELTTDDYERLVNDIRTIAGPAAIHRIADGVEFEVGYPPGGPGSLAMHVRSTEGATTLSF
ncbi:MAG: hypothetical protein ABI601_19350 [bacterium]